MATWLTLFADSQYLKLSGNRPWIGLYKNPAPATQWDAAKIAAIRAGVTGAGFGDPFSVQVNLDVTESNTLGLDGITSYGPNPPGAAGQNAYSVLVAQDKTRWTPAASLQERVLPMTTKLDTRPRAYAFWFDDPVYTEFETRLRRDYAMAGSSRGLCGHSQIFSYSLNELDEGGGSLPNPQSVLRGVNTPSRGVIFDAIKNVMTGAFPSTYSDRYHCASIHTAIAKTGAGWAAVAGVCGPSGGTTGAWKYAEMQSTTVNNTFVWTAPYSVTRIRLYGRTFPTGGTFNCKHDAVANTLVSQLDAGGTTYGVLLYDSGVLAAAVHSLTVTVVTGASLCELECIVSR